MRFLWALTQPLQLLWAHLLVLHLNCEPIAVCSSFAGEFASSMLFQSQIWSACWHCYHMAAMAWAIYLHCLSCHSLLLQMLHAGGLVLHAQEVLL